MGVEVPSCGIYFQSGQNKNLRDEIQAFIKFHSISKSTTNTVQKNFRKFSHDSDGTLKKYSDFKVGEVTSFLRATYHYKELYTWRPEDLRAQEMEKSKLRWVVQEKFVNQVIAAMCDCLTFPLGNRYDHIDWVNEEISNNEDVNNVGDANDVDSEWVFTGNSIDDIKANKKLFKNVIPYQAYFLKIMMDPDLKSYIPNLYLVMMDWYNERNCLTIGSPGMYAVAARGPHMLVTTVGWACSDKIPISPTHEYQKLYNSMVFATLPKHNHVRFFPTHGNVMAVYRFAAYTSTVLNDRVVHLLRVLKICGNGSILNGHKSLHACHRGCSGKHPIKLPECMYKRYDKNEAYVRGGNYKKTKRDFDTANDEDPNQDFVLQGLPACMCCNPHHLQFASNKVHEINKSCQGTIVMPNVENGVVSGKKIINRCNCLSAMEYFGAQIRFIPKDENAGNGKCFHTTFLIDDYYKIEEEETVERVVLGKK